MYFEVYTSKYQVYTYNISTQAMRGVCVWFVSVLGTARKLAFHTHLAHFPVESKTCFDKQLLITMLALQRCSLCTGLKITGSVRRGLVHINTVTHPNTIPMEHRLYSYLNLFSVL